MAGQETLMPTLTPDRIVAISRELLKAAGAPDGHATTVARHLADANLAGHDSHGFIRIPQYLREIREGVIDPKGEPTVLTERAGTAQVDGGATFGQVVGVFALDLAVKKALQSGISFVSMRNLAHTGRIGTYPEMAAKQGMAAIMFTSFVGGEKSGISVAPFGGTRRKMGTNPMSMGFPHADGRPILMDFATSMAAEGKLRVYRAKGEELPDAWVLSKDGVPSRDPNDYYDGGSLLPMGGLQGGYKGYVLAFMVSLFGSIMGELGDPHDLDAKVSGGSSIIVLDVGGMAPIKDVQGQVQEMVRYMKDTPPMKGADGVLYPGEIEERTRQQRLAEGVFVADSTWELIADLIREHGLEAELVAHM